MRSDKTAVSGQSQSELDVAVPGIPAELVWRNGDVLEGQLVSAAAGQLSWATPVFENSLRVRSEAIHMIRFPVQPIFVEETETDIATQIIETIGGNRFFGFVEDTTADTAFIRTELYGRIAIARSAVALISNPVRRAHIFSGPKGLQGWRTLTYGRRLEEWEETLGGKLTTKMVAAELYRQLPANGSVDIDIELAWRHNPSFQIRFITPYEKPTREAIKLETRTGNYVLQTLGSNGRFRQLQTLETTSKRCRLLLRWNHLASELVVLRGHKLLGKITVPKQPTSGLAGIYIKNTGPQLTLNRLEIRAGSTLDIADVDPGTDTVLQADNESLSGTVTDYDATSVTMTIDGEPRELLWKDLAEVSFRSNQVATRSAGDLQDQADAAQSNSQAPNQSGKQSASQSESQPGSSAVGGDSNKGRGNRKTLCVFQNGETLNGELLSSNGAEMIFKVPSIVEPLRCTLSGIERLIFHARSVPPPTGTPTVVVNSKTMHGQLAATADDSIGWMLEGAVGAVKLSDERPAEYSLRENKTRTIGSLQDDLLYLQCGDILPCRVQAANEQEVKLTSEFTGPQLLDSRHVKALELSARPVQPIVGFDKRWTATHKVKAKITDDTIEYLGATTVTRDEVMKGCDRVEFTISKHIPKNAGVFLNIKFTKLNEAGENVVPFYFIGEKTYVMGGRRRNSFVPVLGDSKQVTVRIDTRDPFAVFANDEEIYSSHDNSDHWDNIELNLSYSTAPMMRKTKQPFASIKLSDFRISQTKRPSISHVTGTLESAPLLTIPRHHQAAGSTHLAIGINNDIVRGGLLDLDPDHVRMQVHSRQVDLPRDSVAGMVWLGEETASIEPLSTEQPLAAQESVDQQSAADEKPSLEIQTSDPSASNIADIESAAANQQIVSVILLDTTTITLAQPRLSNGRLSGTHPQLGKCSIPVEEIQGILSGDAKSPMHDYAFLSWKTQQAKQPVLSAQNDLGHRMDSDLLGKTVAFTTVMGDGRTPFRLKDCRGQVVVLDFWASWCAPCIKNMPRLIETMSAFPPERVRLIAINQGEDQTTVQHVCESRGWQVETALDVESSAAKLFQVDAIPRTVVIDAEGKIDAVFVGTSQSLQDELTATINRLLEGTTDAE